MSWSYRKSISAGPFRLNFSKSGISYSAGVKGARINVGPRSTFVNLNTNGISYRQRLSNPIIPRPATTPASVPVLESIPGQIGVEITSGAVDELTDIDSQAFITELNEKASLVPYTPRVTVFLLFLPFLLMFFSFGRRDRVIQAAMDTTLVRIFAVNGTNIRKEPNMKAKILKIASYDEKYALISDSNNKWIKVKVGDSAGYVSRELAELDRQSTTEIKETEWYLINKYLGYEVLLCLLCIGLVSIWLWKLDKKRFTMELHYDMDARYQQIYEQFKEHFNTFCKSSRVWQYLNAQGTTDYKRNAGAGKLIRRVEIKGITGNKAPLPCFCTNVSIPCISLQNMELYFLPERLLMKRGNVFAAVFYKNLLVAGQITNFVESDRLPSDARVVDYTWHYVNKNGDPDKRFSYNPRIPICAYSEYTFTSDTGIFEVLATSKVAAMDDFATFIKKIGVLQNLVGANYQ
ncbi:DUF4236 domain-containing protein [Chitinophaga sp. sic0106]|uniref:DUF4236 domain-containing protein n=1 Tax=Chitinophaga sp. sic0106 TaxID=2854785 RepID=UPI001C440EAA|nr:DUF4236 domain-containing protein [Chitinophaga sp. sic0106]MBV7532852.1 DUF4236 domain-containing protein [Chitinophaga sp. sic0106]